MAGTVVAVSLSQENTFTKPNSQQITLLTELGVEGDAHMGETVKHRSRMARDPHQANLRQVHLIHGELLGELQAGGFEVYPDAMGENVTTRGIDLLGLPTGTRLAIGDNAMVKVTGLRNPCAQIDNFQSGLLAAVLDKDEQGNVVRKSGIMGIVIEGGVIAPGDEIQVLLPAAPHRPLEVV